MKKIILITGASSGIGKASAMKLIEEGHVVYGVARRVEKMNDLKEAGGHIEKLDITKSQDINRVIDKIIHDEGRIDVLINNAGYAVYGPVETVSIEDARKQFDVNIFGLAELTKKVLPHMREAKKGRIINVSSVGGRVHSLYGAWYHATKFALEGWSDCLRLEMKPFGIDVSIIEPGMIKTEMGDNIHQPLLNRIEGTVYESLGAKMANFMTESFNKPAKSSPPSVIAGAISKAVNDTRPKTRYVAGKMSKISLWFKRLTSDKLYDKLMLDQFK